VPFAVKDEEDLGGYPTTHGSMPWRNAVVPRDSTQVARARAAGAIVIGKTNLPEFGSTAFTKNHVFGTTRNPWNLARTPGGSSGGSSAAVARACFRARSAATAAARSASRRRTRGSSG
jgi:aspartyl-tRNA(Asn)/glutamyl-tRNA(Gln) amidotransferase subunit A